MTIQKVLVVISANVEWHVVTTHFGPGELSNAVYNQWFSEEISGKEVIFFHGGWGKISAAASAQYALDRWKPDLLINLGTCGGFSGSIEPGEILLANETVVYDIVERMGDSQAALDFYTTRLDLDFITNTSLNRIRQVRLISADRDIDPGEITALRVRFQALAADWESGAISWVASRNQTRCLILRAVSDLVGEKSGEVYGDWELFVQRTRTVMTSMLHRLPEWLESLG